MVTKITEQKIEVKSLLIAFDSGHYILENPKEGNPQYASLPELISKYPGGQLTQAAPHIPGLNL